IASESGADAASRNAAIAAIGGDPQHTDTLLGILSGDADASVRAAAAKGLHGIKEEKVVSALRGALDADADGTVRGEALLGLKKAGAEGTDALICAAMKEDESAEVRKRAISAYRGTKRKEAIACLRDRALTLEEDPAVRSTLLSVLKSSPKKAAKKVLCDAIPFWVRSYMKEELPPKVAGADIIKAQNDRDWDNSYDCIGKAYRAGGYSCFGRLYVGHWFREVGGSAYLPNCPGYENPALAGG
ncbi:MAG: HEAT repeat domain-containing protein, partial [Myxococcota bacterium]|nr:HEAT repeat domain-containing protein [Myxococcota bacterium]